jgi:hypothetical protein
LKYRVSLFAFSHHSQEDIAADKKAAASIMSSGKYAHSPEWADIDPIPLDDGSGNGDGIIPLATIAYPPSYTEATSYLRAVMAVNEMSDRALKLTEDIIRINPAHYTVWYVFAVHCVYFLLS